MALVESKPCQVGWKMPKWQAPTPDNSIVKPEPGSKGTLIIFTCNHCPYAKAIWPRTIELAENFSDQINTYAINPNIHPDYPEDSPEEMTKKIKEWSISFPYLIDYNQEIARAFDAQCTPDLYLFDRKEELFYHGRFDNNWKNPSAVTNHDLKDSIELLITNKPAPSKIFPSIGCSIKWH